MVKIRRKRKRIVKVQDPFLHLVVSQFPEHKQLLETLYRQDEFFRSLCEEFHDCARAMEYWCGCPPDHDKARALCEEYKALYTDLKGEIAKRLAEQKEKS